MKFIVGYLPPEFKYLATLTDADLYKSYIQFTNGEIDWESTLRVLNASFCKDSHRCHTYYVSLLNYLTDDEAKDSIYVFVPSRSELKLLFSHPDMKEKLTMMGPGEAIADTELSKLIW